MCYRWLYFSILLGGRYVRLPLSIFNRVSLALRIRAMPGRCDPFAQHLGLCWMVTSLPVITRLNWTHLVNECHESVISHMKIHEACLVKSWIFHVITSSYPLHGEIRETGWVPVSIPSNDECKHRCCQGDWTEPGRYDRLKTFNVPNMSTFDQWHTGSGHVFLQETPSARNTFQKTRTILHLDTLKNAVRSKFHSTFSVEKLLQHHTVIQYLGNQKAWHKVLWDFLAHCNRGTTKETSGKSNPRDLMAS